MTVRYTKEVFDFTHQTLPSDTTRRVPLISTFISSWGLHPLNVMMEVDILCVWSVRSHLVDVVVLHGNRHLLDWHSQVF